MVTSPLKSEAECEEDFLLQPVRDLVLLGKSDNYLQWEATGVDPQFSIALGKGARLRAGHYVLQLRTHEPHAFASATIYIDRETGFTEAEAITPTIIRKGEWLRFEFAINSDARRLRFDPCASPGRFSIGAPQLNRRRRVAHYATLARRVIQQNVKSPRDAVRISSLAYTSLASGGLRQLAADIRRSSNRGDYIDWLARYGTITDADRTAMLRASDRFASRPLISIIMPTFNTPEALLREAIESVRSQTYQNWELCIADDASSQPPVRLVLEHYLRTDKRIKVIYRPENGHISHASNSALELATGEWVALLDHDDILHPHALFCVADAINRHPEAKLFYSDEDKIDLDGRRFNPYFKCDWNLDLFLSHNLITHLGVYERNHLQRIGGFRAGFEGAQDYDLALRFIGALRPEQIIHIPHVLYSWRVMPGSTALAAAEKPYAMLAGERALNEYLAQTAPGARAELIGIGYRVHYPVPDPAPLVSIIIPTRNAAQLVAQCIQSVRRLSTYPNYEIILVDNGSDDPEALRLFHDLAVNDGVRVIRDEREFNYSMLNNSAVTAACGSLIVLLNNDIKVITPDWLEELVALALQPGVGAVGTKLYYPDDTIQHAGVILGIGGVAAHVFTGFPRTSFGYAGRATLRQSLSAVTAACLMVRKDHYLSVGGLDEENLKVAFNDVDLCLKLRQRGLRNVWTPFAEHYHLESATRGYETTPEKIKRFEQEHKFLRAKWGDNLTTDPAYSPNLTLERTDFSLAFPPRVPAPWWPARSRSL